MTACEITLEDNVLVSTIVRCTLCPERKQRDRVNRVIAAKQIGKSRMLCNVLFVIRHTRERINNTFRAWVVSQRRSCVTRYRLSLESYRLCTDQLIKTASKREKWSGEREKNERKLTEFLRLGREIVVRFAREDISHFFIHALFVSRIIRKWNKVNFINDKKFISEIYIRFIS